MNIDMELEEARKGAYEAVRVVSESAWSEVYSAELAAAASAVDSALNSTYSATRKLAWAATRSARSAAYLAETVYSPESYNEERLKQVERIKAVL